MSYLFFLSNLISSHLCFTAPPSIWMDSTKNRIDNAAQRFTLPDTTQLNTHHPHVPPIFVIQVLNRLHRMVPYCAIASSSSPWVSCWYSCLGAFLCVLCTVFLLTFCTNASIVPGSCMSLVHTHTYTHTIFLEFTQSYHILTVPYFLFQFYFFFFRFKFQLILHLLFSPLWKTDLGGRFSCTIKSLR